jgi:cell division transport system permease protein
VRAAPMWRPLAPVRAARNLAVNVAELIVRDSLRGWARNGRAVGLSVAALALVLLLAGVATLGALAVRDVLQAEARAAAVLHVYVRDGATPAQVASLRARLAGDGRVSAVRYVSKDDALREARQRPDLRYLLSEAGGNPLPASFEVQVRDPGQLQALSLGVASDPAVDPANPTSSEGGAYPALVGFARAAGAAVAVLLVALAMVAAALTAVGLKGGLEARRDEVAVMRLAGASAWVLRGTCVLQGALTGALAALLAAAAIAVLFALARRASALALALALPGVGWGSVLACAVGLVVAGMLLGSAASLPGLREIRR